jgi:hypothetical protein
MRGERRVHVTPTFRSEYRGCRDEPASAMTASGLKPMCSPACPLPHDESWGYGVRSTASMLTMTVSLRCQEPSVLTPTFRSEYRRRREESASAVTASGLKPMCSPACPLPHDESWRYGVRSTASMLTMTVRSLYQEPSFLTPTFRSRHRRCRQEPASAVTASGLKPMCSSACSLPHDESWRYGVRSTASMLTMTVSLRCQEPSALTPTFRSEYRGCRQESASAMTASGLKPMCSPACPLPRGELWGYSVRSTASMLTMTVSLRYQEPSILTPTFRSRHRRCRQEPASAMTASGLKPMCSPACPLPHDESWGYGVRSTASMLTMTVRSLYQEPSFLTPTFRSEYRRCRQEPASAMTASGLKPMCSPACPLPHDESWGYGVRSTISVLTMTVRSPYQEPSILTPTFRSRHRRCRQESASAVTASGLKPMCSPACPLPHDESWGYSARSTASMLTMTVSLRYQEPSILTPTFRSEHRRRREESASAMTIRRTDSTAASRRVMAKALISSSGTVPTINGGDSTTHPSTLTPTLGSDYAQYSHLTPTFRSERDTHQYTTDFSRERKVRWHT